MHRDAEWQWMVVRIPQQDGDDLHSWRSGLPLSILQSSLHRPLTVNCILSHLTTVWGQWEQCSRKGALEKTLVTFQFFLLHIKGTGVSSMCEAAHLGSALRWRYCLRYQRMCCWGRKRATHRDKSCQHYRKRWKKGENTMGNLPICGKFTKHLFYHIFLVLLVCYCLKKLQINRK